MNSNEQQPQSQAQTSAQPITAPTTATNAPYSPNQPTTPLQGGNVGSAPKQNNLKLLLILMIAIIVLVALVVGGFFVLRKQDNKSVSTTTPPADATRPNTTPDTADSVKSVKYTDADNGFSFDPGTSMTSAKSPFLYSGTPVSGGGQVLIAKNVVSVSSSDERSVKAALQSVKLKGFTGTDPNPVTVTRGSMKSYTINYKSEQEEVWQMGFYSQKSGSVVVLSLITPYIDAETSDNFMNYAQKVFQSVKLSQ